MNYADFNVNQVRQKLPQNEFYNRRLTHLKVSTTPGEPLGLDSGKKHRWDEPEVPRFSFSGTAKSHIGSFVVKYYLYTAYNSLLAAYPYVRAAKY